MKIKGLLRGIGMGILSSTLVLSAGLNATYAKQEGESSQTKQESNTDAIFNELNQLRNNGASIEEGKKFLKKNGIIVEKVKTMKINMETGEEVSEEDFNAQAFGATVVTVNNWIDKNRDGSRYYIYAELSRSSGYEYNPGDYDVLSINYDDSKYDYLSYGYTNGNLIWASDLTQGNNGTIIFNVADNWYTSENYIAGWATTIPIGSGRADTNIKFSHSFDEYNTSSSAGISFGGKKDIGVNYTIDWSTTQNSWSKADSSYVYLNY